MAAALFTTLVLGVLPLFTRATLLNLAGRTSTTAAHLARSRTEELSRLPFDSAALVRLADGQPAVEYLPAVEGGGSTEYPPEGALWVRSTRVRAFRSAALEDSELSDDEALPAGADLTSVHLWEIEVHVRPLAGGSPAAAGRQMILRRLKVR